MGPVIHHMFGDLEIKGEDGCDYWQWLIRVPVNHVRFFSIYKVTQLDKMTTSEQQEFHMNQFRMKLTP